MTTPNPNFDQVFRGYRITGTMASGFSWTDEQGGAHGPHANAELAMHEVSTWLSDKGPLARGPESET